ncbi:endonuclease domain-containing protein, partial [Bradyrhizobium lablabi]|uniref:endonuclease domain-containing protein n=1 Tax=Bradyrhizobium lablabi TaxID=722472 RepID=UPI003908B4D9
SVACCFAETSVAFPTSPRSFAGRGRIASQDAIRVRGMAMRGRNEEPIRRARRLRANQTEAETVLWNRIRNRQIDGYKFARQVPIGHYIRDFVCRESRMVIEVDGGQHAESAADALRDRYLASEGYRVLRFWNNDVLRNIEGVLITIQLELRG